MYEKKHEPLAPFSTFILRILKAVFIGLFLIVITLYIGMLGLRYLESMTWVDAFANASMIMSGVGAITPIISHAGKIFGGIYSICGGIVFMTVIALFFTPIIHRSLHKFHLDGGCS